MQQTIQRSNSNPKHTASNLEDSSSLVAKTNPEKKRITSKVKLENRDIKSSTEQSRSSKTYRTKSSHKKEEPASAVDLKKRDIKATAKSSSEPSQPSKAPTRIMLVEKIKELETKHKKDIDDLEEKNKKNLIELEKKYEERISQLERQLNPVQKQKSSEELILAEKEKSLIITHNRRVRQLNEKLEQLKSAFTIINRIKFDPLEFICIPEIKENYKKWEIRHTETLSEFEENRMNMMKTQNSELIVLLLKENVFLNDFFKIWIEFSGICKYILEERK